MSCSYNQSCCTAQNGSKMHTTIYGSQSGFAPGDGTDSCLGNKNCGPTDSPCHNDVITYCTQETNGVSKLFDTSGFCATAANDPIYGPTMRSYRAMYCSIRENYAPHQDGGSNKGGDRCAHWWATDKSSWGSSDTAVSDYCSTAQSMLNNGTLSATDKTYYQQVCGCATSQMECPQVVDPQCSGGNSADLQANGNKTDLQPAYHTAGNISQTCPPVTICNQFSTMGDGAITLGVQKQGCSGVQYATLNSIKMLIFLIILIFVVNLAIMNYAFYKNKIATS